MFTLRLLGSASLEGPDGPVVGRAALRQRIALLALLAVEHPRPLSRDKLVANLWPESATGDARHLLRESLYILRSALGEESMLSGGDDLRLNPDRLSCDLWEFEAALGRGDLEPAVAVYHGPFLSGFHLSDAEEFEHWADGERSRLARRYGQALEQLAEGESKRGDPVRAAEWWSRLASEDPYNSRIALRYMQALEGAGDRAGALRHASIHSELLRSELGAAPEREVVALAERIRIDSRAAAGGEPMLPQPIATVPAAVEGDGQDPHFGLFAAEPGPPIRRRWLLQLVATALVLSVVIGLGVLGGTLSRPPFLKLAPHRVAAAPFENRTGRPDLDDLGALAADWIIRGVMETPLVDVTDLEAVYARRTDHGGGLSDPRTLAQQDGAGIVVRGSYYLSGDSVLFQAGIIDVASGRILRSFDPVGAPIERATVALETLRERIASGLSPLVSPLSPVDPDLIQLPSLPAYREFVAGLKEDDWEVAAQHYRRAARLDSTFVTPLIELAFNALRHDQCSITDSIGAILEHRRDQLPAWSRITMDMLRARCRGEPAKALGLLAQRYRAYPRSLLARATYAGWLQSFNQPRAARAILRSFAPLEGWEAWYWWQMAASWHMLGEYRAELSITDRWRDSATWEWQIARGRALGALGREREVMEFVSGMTGGSTDSVAERHLTIATELAVHGHSQTAMAIAESVLVRLELGKASDWKHAANIGWANRLLGRAEPERRALERIGESDADTLAKLEAEARIAVLLADTARAERIDSILAEQSARPMLPLLVRGATIVARAHIATGFGRRDQAVALLQEACARGVILLGSSHAFHEDLLLAPLRGYPPFEALLKPDG
ncbi:MAG TPA: BTAD domain-containing putative transcriptional regulator [Gemmatimonadales bacterium]|nr:BTAD domain-containing putative transcriptional regulator [Gemmatimonadales bacterium]